MIYNKTPYLANFRTPERFDSKSGNLEIGGTTLHARIKSYAGDIHHILISGPGLWSENLNLVPLNWPEEVSDSTSLSVDDQFGIRVLQNDDVLLESSPGFGRMGEASLFAFAFAHDMRFYGMGEKTYGTFEMGKRRSRFWNTDALGDFHYRQWAEDACDPYYVSVPYLIVRRGNTYIGLLLHNPFPSWIDTGSDPSFFGTEDENRRVVLGADGGQPSLVIIVGPTLAELTTKLQKLVGTTPRPPLWALGYHQCRWEYKGEENLLWLDENMTKHQIPNDGLWLDIDYMHEYRVFTYDKDAFPRGPAETLKKLNAKGRKIVPIIDPGVKREAGNPLFEDGLKKGLFCLNPEGEPFVGFVWPGETVFPDFSKPEARDWWAGHCRAFLELGFAGAWVDMNDPSTGSVDPYAMLWRDGKYPHGAFRNQYALGMQMATRTGFQAADPNRRVFVLSRSGYTGTSNFSAIWTGDNVSNRFYLRGSIPTTINLGLSGIPFNGPDVGGFQGNTNEPLMVDWIKAGFLFPFFRNHSVKGFRRQEPWTFSKEGNRIITHYTRLRYKLLPYLYQLFIRQEREGEAILRPVHYDFEAQAGEWPDDIFMVGPNILQAPCLDETQGRKVRLPGGRNRWFDARTGEWIRAKVVEVDKDPFETPLFFCEGSVVPTLPGERKNADKDLRHQEVHLFAPIGSMAAGHVIADDGETLAYQKGTETEVRVMAKWVGTRLYVETHTVHEGYGPITLDFVTYERPSAVYVNGTRVATRKFKVRWTGREALSAVKFTLPA